MMEARDKIHFARAKRILGQADWLISTHWLKPLRVLHLAPIKVVVYDQPSSPYGEGIPILEGGLALRCFQRLSLPNIATRPLPLAGQPEHQRSVFPGPLVLRKAPLQVSLRPHQIETDNNVTFANSCEGSIISADLCISLCSSDCILCLPFGKLPAYSL